MMATRLLRFSYGYILWLLKLREFIVTILRSQIMQVKIIVNLKGRENEFRNIAIELIRRFQNDVGEVLLIWVYILFPLPPLSFGAL